MFTVSRGLEIPKMAAGGRVSAAPITIQAILLRADDRAGTLLVRFRPQEIADVLGLTLAPVAPPVIAQWMTLGAKDAAMLRAQGVMRLTLPGPRAEALIRRWASKS
jgi:hypothetical protein